MKRSFTLFVSMLVLLSLLLTACGTALPATAARSGSTDDSATVEFVGKVEAIIDNKWTINGQTVEVNADLAKQLPFQVGDEVKVEAIVNADGSVRAQSIVSFDAAANDNGNNSNDDNGNADNSNNANDTAENSNDANANSNADNSNAANSNDANGNADNSNDDTGYDDNSNAGNGNDDNSNADNSNDDNGNAGNSNDDNGNADNSNDDNSNNDNDNDDKGDDKDDDKDDDKNDGNDND